MVAAPSMGLPARPRLRRPTDQLTQLISGDDQPSADPQDAQVTAVGHGIGLAAADRQDHRSFGHAHRGPGRQEVDRALLVCASLAHGDYLLNSTCDD